MEAIWREYKRFIVALCGGAGIVFLYLSFVVGGLDGSARAIRATRTTEEARLQSLLARGLPEESSVRKAKADVAAAKEGLASLVTEVSFPSSPRYEPAAGESREKHFESLKNRIYEELQALSVQKQVVFPPTLGFDAVPKDCGEEFAVELLLRLSACEHLVRRILESAPPDSKIEALDPLHRSDLQEGAAAPDGRFLVPSSLRVKVTSDSKCVFGLLHALQQRGKFFSVESFDAVRTDPMRDRFTVEAVVSLLRLDPQGALHPGAEGGS